MRKLLSAIGVVAGVGLIVVFGPVLAFALFELVALSKGDPFVIGFLVVGLATGVLLIRWSAPGVFARVAGAVGAGVRVFFSAQALVNPIGLAGWVILVCGAGMGLSTALGIRDFIPLHPFFILMGGLLFYMLVTTVVLVVLEHWWVRAVVTLLTAPVLLMVLYGMAEVMQPKSIGEASLAFVGPVIVHWGVVPATGLLKLLVRNFYTPPAPR